MRPVRVSHVDQVIEPVRGLCMTIGSQLCRGVASLLNSLLSKVSNRAAVKIESGLIRQPVHKNVSRTSQLPSTGRLRGNNGE